ncbi:MAG: DUF389 domain-containing protein [Bacteroidales bacterium]|nr:DUF389 domain-containing protein [Bacteroidales bacterium]
MNSKRLIVKALRILSIKTELESFDFINEEIKKGVQFRGTNLWILIFAILVASVGLNMNSTAVIIGAMLISPLMGPINGVGYSIATYNFPLLRESLRNFGYAIGISLITSTLYFILTPISTAQSELLARTSPTIYDVLIALFGGFAGIVAISSRNKGNVIPGVAIATALMPPLCTAGYGLATMQFKFFYGAFYLFTINSVFIAIASMLISQILKFPIRDIIDASKKKRINQIISVIIALVFIPSIYFGYQLIQKERFSENADKYIANISNYEGNFLLKSNVDSDKRIINLIYAGKNLTEEQKERIKEKALSFNLKQSKIIIEQGLSFQEVDNKSAETLRLQKELYEISNLLEAKTEELDSIRNLAQTGNALLNELRKFYPEIKSLSYANTLEYNDTTNLPKTIKLVILKAKDSPIQNNDKEKINQWVETRLKEQNVRVIYE